MPLIYGKQVLCTSKRQALVSLISCEAQYIAFSKALKEVLFIYEVFDDINVLIDSSIVYRNTNSGEYSANHPTNHGTSKHVDIQYPFIRADDR